MRALVLSEALPPLRRYHGKTVVIKYGGNAMTDPALQTAFAQDVVLLQLMGIKPVVVHGGGPQIEAALQSVGKVGAFIQGLRVTDAQTLKVVEWVLAGEVQQDIVGRIHQAGGKAVGLTGRDGGLIRAKRLQGDVDLGFVGEIEGIDPSVVRALQAQAFIPVISPIGFDAQGQSYNINADVVAAQVACALGAEKLLLLTNTAGVLDKAGQLIGHLSAARVDALVQDGTLFGGMLPKISGALAAASDGVPAVHILDGRVLHATLLAVLSDEARGTLITA